MDVALSEANLVRRVRSLAPGTHLVAITVDAHGLEGAAVLAQGKSERLRPVECKTE